MATWSFILSVGGSPLDITGLVDLRSVSRERRLHTDLKPNVNKVSFRVLFDASLHALLLSADTVDVSIVRSGSAYLTGTISPNFKTTLRDGVRYISLIAEDYTLQRLGRTIAAPLALAGYYVCNPASPSTSLVHTIAAAAGVTCSSVPALPSLLSVVPYVIAMPDEKETYGSLLAGILFEYKHVAHLLENGTLFVSPLVNSGAVVTGGTLSTETGAQNIVGEPMIEKVRERFDDVRVRYDVLEYKTGIVVFQDTTGATDAAPCRILLKPTGDAEGRDYYPLTAKIGEVLSAWQNPEGLEILVVEDPVLDVTYDSGIVVSRALTNYFRRCSFAFRNTTGVDKYISKLRITGNAWVIASKNVARTSVTSGKNLFLYDAQYLFSDTAARALVDALAQYYRFSDFRYAVKSKTAYGLGDYVLFYDPIYSGLSVKGRVVGILDKETEPDVFEYAIEAVSDFIALSLITEGSGANHANQGDIGGVSPQSIAATSFVWYNNLPPTNNVTGLSFVSAANPNGGVDVIPSWEYVQGAVGADGFIVYARREISTPGAIDLAADAVAFIPASAATEYSAKLTLPTRAAGAGTLPIHYRFGVVAVGTRRAGTIPHAGGVVEDAAWLDKTFSAIIAMDDYNFWNIATGEFRARTANGDELHINPAVGISITARLLQLEVDMSRLFSVVEFYRSRTAYDSPESGDSRVVAGDGAIGFDEYDALATAWKRVAGFKALGGAAAMQGIVKAKYGANSFELKTRVALMPRWNFYAGVEADSTRILSFIVNYSTTRLQVRIGTVSGDAISWGASADALVALYLDRLRVMFVTSTRVLQTFSISAGRLGYTYGTYSAGAYTPNIAVLKETLITDATAICVNPSEVLGTLLVAYNDYASSPRYCKIQKATWDDSTQTLNMIGSPLVVAECEIGAVEIELFGDYYLVQYKEKTTGRIIFRLYTYDFALVAHDIFPVSMFANIEKLPGRLTEKLFLFKAGSQYFRVHADNPTELEPVSGTPDGGYFVGIKFGGLGVVIENDNTNIYTTPFSASEYSMSPLATEAQVEAVEDAVAAEIAGIEASQVVVEDAIDLGTSVAANVTMGAIAVGATVLRRYIGKITNTGDRSILTPSSGTYRLLNVSGNYAATDGANVTSQLVPRRQSNRAYEAASQAICVIPLSQYFTVEILIKRLS